MRRRILTLPGWKGSDPIHWQSRWEALHGFERVEQHDWQQPRRGDWMARLDEVLLDGGDARPVVLVAHSLGAQLVAAWAAHSRHAARVAAALLVAPPDTERADTPPALSLWRPMPMQRLPFPATLVASTDDPYCSLDRAGALAQAWGAALVVAGARGHLNSDSDLGDWPAGLALFHELLSD